MKGKIKEVRKRKLVTVTLIRLVIILVITLTTIDLAVGLMLQREILNIYEDFSFSYTKMLSENIDTDRVETYLKTKKLDSYYVEVSNEMRRMVSTAGLRYLYVFVPEEKGIRYIWDSQADDDSRPFMDVWEYSGDYPKDAVFEAYETGEDRFDTYSYGDMYLAASITPLKNSKGETIAIVEADILMPRIKSSAIRIALFTLLYLFVILIATMVVFFTFVRRRIIGPLIKLNIASVEMIEGLESNKELVIDVHTGDEIETVARSFENMNRRLHEYIEANNEIQKEKERVNAELNLATKLQADILPTKFPAFPNRNEILIYADMTPAKEVGGDFYDFFFVDDDNLAVLMADVSGKGIPAAMFMMMARSLLASRVVAGKDPGTILEEVNNVVCSNNPEMMFVTIWLGILNVKTGVFSAANAGHEKPILYTPGGEFEIINDKHGAIVGLKKNMKYPVYEIKMEPGSKLLVYTDGVPEATDNNNEQFGMERLLKAINSAPDGKPEDVLMLIDRDVYRFLDNAEQFDDLTMLCVGYYGANGECFPED